MVTRKQEKLMVVVIGAIHKSYHKEETLSQSNVMLHQLLSPYMRSSFRKLEQGFSDVVW